MSYLDFIDSRTVREHLESIGYRPDGLTEAFIIVQSKSHTLMEKLEALSKVPDHTEDMVIPAHEYHRERPSLHAFLTDYIGLILRNITAFEKGEEGGVYDLAVYFGAPDYTWLECSSLHSTFEGVMEDVREFAEDVDLPCPIRFRLRQRLVDVPHDACYLHLTGDGKYYTYASERIMPDEDYEMLHLFDNICLPIPHPFRRGDIVRECVGRYGLPLTYEDTLLVDEYYTEEFIRDHQHELGAHNYSLFGFICDEEGGIDEDSIDHYLRAERVPAQEVQAKDLPLIAKSGELREK